MNSNLARNCRVHFIATVEPQPAASTVWAARSSKFPGTKMLFVHNHNLRVVYIFSLIMSMLKSVIRRINLDFKN